MTPAMLSAAPRARIGDAVRRLGDAAVAAAAIDLAAGRSVDTAWLDVLGGRAGQVPVPPYWHRVWGLRGLLWCWADEALPVLRAALGDDAWRVREMAAKVVARHRLDDLLDDVAALRVDRVVRVRAAAQRAVMRLTRG